MRFNSHILVFILGFWFCNSCFSQTEKEIEFSSSTPGIILSGTITEAINGKGTIAIVLLPVAGPTDRDLTLGTHKYYKTLADGLAKQGIISLRFDDRGVGKSTGDLFNSSLQDRTSDAVEAMKFLKSQLPHIDSFGFIGMSEGAGISVLAADSIDNISFLVLLSMPVREGQVEMENQLIRLLKSSKFSEENKEKIKEEALRFLGLVGSQDPNKNRDAILDLLQGKYGSVVLPPYGFVPTTPEEKTDFVLSEWYQSQLNYNIESALSGIKVPALAIYGELDKAIDWDTNAKLLNELSPDIESLLLPGKNHLMQNANTGSPMEYVFLPESFSEEVIEKIVTWIRELP